MRGKMREIGRERQRQRERETKTEREREREREGGLMMEAIPTEGIFFG